MPSDPVVACILLTRDRPAMTERAYQSFLSQTYERKTLIVYDNSAEPSYGKPVDGGPNVHVRHDAQQGRTIGELRNAANAIAAATGCDLIVHWDSDDWSHSNRLAEQVALIEASGAQAVGYNSIPFFREQERDAWIYAHVSTRRAVGTSLMYRTGVWRQSPFPALPVLGYPLSVAEDSMWLANPALNIYAVPGVGNGMEPRIIASVHDRNTQTMAGQAIGVVERSQGNVPEFKRAPEWDQFCAERMRL